MQTISRRAILKSILFASFSGFAALVSGNGFGAARKERHADDEPGYMELHRSGELKQRGEQLWELMRRCELCPRMCGVNKIEGEKGFCQAKVQHFDLTVRCDLDITRL